MKRSFYVSMVLVLFSILIVGAEAFGTTSLYDDFSSFVNYTTFENPESINAIESRITVVETELDTGTDAMCFGRIEGFFYNTQASGEAGDLWATVIIGDVGNGLEAYWEMWEVLDDRWENRGSGTLIGPGTLTKGTPYTARIEYDATNGFAFTVSGVSSGPVAGPARQRAAVTPFKALATAIYATGGPGTGYASAVFDDVYINNEAVGPGQSGTMEANSDDGYTAQATYDATGTWSYSTTNNWADPPCPPMPDETNTVSVTQTGDTVTMVDNYGNTWTGTVSGADYTLSTSFDEAGGTVTANLDFTLSSSTSGSGTLTWSWTDNGNSCNGGSDATVTKVVDEEPPPPSGGGGGGGG